MSIQEIEQDLTIQEQIELLHHFTQRREIQFFGIAMSLVVVCYFTDDLGYAIAILVVYIGIAIGVHKAFSSWRETRKRELYKYQAFPIIEIQRHQNDDQCFKRANEHRKLLEQAKNLLYEKGIIEVLPIFLKQAEFGIAESAEKQQQMREDFIRDYINAWGKKQSVENKLLITKWVYKQDIGDEDQATNADIADKKSLIAMNDYLEEHLGEKPFWSFPLLTRLTQLLRGKEVEAA